MKQSYEFYEITHTTLEQLASLRGLSSTELETYYRTTDKHFRFYKTLSGIPQVFAQMAFHVQNAQRMNKFIAFEKNFGIFREITEGFVPEVFLAKFRNADVLAEVIAKRLGRKNGGFTKRYANALIASAKYLVNFHFRGDLIEDLLQNGGRNEDAEALIGYFRKKVPYGFGIALSCDFLKELDDCFSFLAKPDVHLMDTVCALKGRARKNYEGEKGISLVKDMQELVDEINGTLRQKGERTITVYQLDRMIWLICSENFFLHDVENGKEIYIKKIAGCY